MFRIKITRILLTLLILTKKSHHRQQSTYSFQLKVVTKHALVRVCPCASVVNLLLKNEFSKNKSKK